jgi:hypothetical protein
MIMLIPCIKPVIIWIASHSLTRKPWFPCPAHRSRGDTATTDNRIIDKSLKMIASLLIVTISLDAVIRSEIVSLPCGFRYKPCAITIITLKHAHMTFS